MPRSLVRSHASSLTLGLGCCGVALLYTGLYFAVFKRLAAQWSTDPNSSHGFLVPIVSAYLTWDQRESLRRLPIEPSAIGGVVLLAGLSMLLLGTLGAELLLQNLSTVFVLIGLVWLLAGSAIVRQLAFPLGFLAFYVPVPALLLNQIAFPLQLLAARAATATLAWWNVPALREGNVIQLVGTTLEVAEACSGIRSLQALIALSAVYGYVAQTNWWKRAALVVLALPTAVVANALRVSGTGLIAHKFGVEKAEGFYHGFAGWLIFGVAFALLVVFNWLLTRIGKRGGEASTVVPRVSARKADSQDITLQDALPVGQVLEWRGRSAWAYAALMLAGCWALVSWLNRVEPTTGRNVLEGFPMQVGDRWFGHDVELSARELDVLQATGVVMRSYSATPEGGIPPNAQSLEPVLLYIAYYQSQRTGATYHSPQHCMPGNGWEITSLVPVGLTVSEGGARRNVTLNEVVLQKGLEKLLVLYWYHDRGRIVASEYWAKAYMVWDALSKNRSDGALVRISIPVTDEIAPARERLLGFVTDFWPTLERALPGAESPEVAPVPPVAPSESIH